MVCFDNLTDGSMVKSPILSRMLTAKTHTGRILGISKMAELPTSTVFVVTGNNITTDMCYVRVQRSDGSNILTSLATFCRIGPV
jgi:hypothetical protein